MDVGTCLARQPSLAAAQATSAHRPSLSPFETHQRLACVRFVLALHTAAGNKTFLTRSLPLLVFPLVLFGACASAVLSTHASTHPPTDPSAHPSIYPLNPLISLFFSISLNC